MRTAACAQFDEPECSPLFTGATYELGVTVLSQFRLHFFDVPGGGVLLVTLEAHHGVDLDAFAERASPVLAASSSSTDQRRRRPEGRLLAWTSG